MKPSQPGFYLCHVNQRALIEHKPILFWDGTNWCSDSSPSRVVLAIQNRYWCKQEGGNIKLHCQNSESIGYEKMNEVPQLCTTPIDQLKDTSAMLAVLLEDIYDVAPEAVKNRICEELGKINKCIRDLESSM